MMSGIGHNTDDANKKPGNGIVNGLKKLKVVSSVENEMKLTDGEITITTGRCAYYHGKHHMNDPANAKATFIRAGKRYMLKNTQRIATIEDWYMEELLPKLRQVKNN